MAPSARRRAPPPPPPQFTHPASESDEDGLDGEDDEQGALVGGHLPEGATLDVDDEEPEEEEEDVEEPQALESDDESSLADYSPIPPNYREISTLASWTVSSCKPGCGVPQLRSPSTTSFWQSDGPQPHYLNIHFFKLVRIVGLRLYLDFEADESYTPTRIIFLAGSGQNDLVEWGEMRLEQPRGWIWADFEGVDSGSESEEESNSDDSNDDDDEDHFTHTPGIDPSDYQHPLAPSGGTRARSSAIGAGAGAGAGADTLPIETPRTYPHAHAHALPSSQPTPSGPALHRTEPRAPLHPLTPSLPAPKRRKPRTPILRAHLVQIKILENHQNGKDTHLRGLQIFAKDTEMGNGAGKRRQSVGQMCGNGEGKGSGMGVGREMKVDVEGRRRRGLERSVWDVEPSIR